MTESRERNGEILYTGEIWRDDIQKYVYQWTEFKKRRYAYASNVFDLRKKEKMIKRRLERMEGCIDCTITLNELFFIWLEEKRGIRENTLEGYINTYKNHLYNSPLGKMMLIDIKKPKIRNFYLDLVDSKKASVNTISQIQQVLHQVLKLGVDYDYIDKNPSDELLGEIIRIENYVPNRRIALTMNQEKIFISELGDEDISWKAIFLTFLTTGLRVSELVGLQWSDIDFENKKIYVNKTLVYYKHSKGKCELEIHTPKTPAGIREVPLMDSTAKILQIYRNYQKKMKISCNTKVGIYHNFCFINRNGLPFNQQNLNRTLKKIIKGYNEKETILAEKENRQGEFLPNFSCHCLRHTFATRFCEVDRNYKKLQYILGHRDIQTTLNLYAHGSLEAVIPTVSELENYLLENRMELDLPA